MCVSPSLQMLTHFYCCQFTVPTPPLGLSVTARTPVSITLLWQHAQNTFSSYDIYYEVGNSNNRILADIVDGAINTYTVTGLDPGTTYSFYLFTVTGATETNDRTVSDTPAVTIGFTGK